MMIIAGFVFFILVVLGIMFFYRIGKPVNSSLSDAYYFHAWKRKIVYSPMGNWFELGYHEMDADPKTFTVLSKEFARNEHVVFWKGKKQRVDCASFLLDQSGIPKDKQNVYYDLHNSDTLLLIEEADPKTYHQLTTNKANYYQYFALDDRSVFVDGKKIEADRHTFKILNKTLAIDSHFVYAIRFNSKLLAGNPGATEVLKKMANPGGIIKDINESYVSAGNIILFSNWKNEFASIPFSEIDSIRVIDERNIAVNNQLISDGKLVADVDLASLEIIDRDFFKDKKSVFYDTEKITQADPKSFEIVFEDYSRDNRLVFYKQKILAGADPLRFAYDFSTGIASDGKLSFKDGELLLK